MRLLLDTHTYIWTISGAERLPRSARVAIADPANDLYLSVASLWKATIKIAKGSLHMRGRIVDFLLDEMAGVQVRMMPISASHLRVLQVLPALHKDPFGRTLVAQAIPEGVPLVIADSTLRRYTVETIWA